LYSGGNRTGPSLDWLIVAFALLMGLWATTGLIVGRA